MESNFREMMMMKNTIRIGLLLITCLWSGLANAQFTVDGQLVQRAEYRHGYGNLISEGQDAAMFIGQRARINAQYNTDKFTFYTSIQDVRIWGSAPQIKAFDPYLSVHEAWAATKFGEHISIKLGRQELNYDNARFLGNLDWALQGRAHDFALFKYEKENRKLHIGAGYNQDAERLSGTIFTTPNQYKVAQMVRYESALGNLNYALLFWNNGRQYVEYNDPILQTEVLNEGVRYMQTLGVPTLKYQLNNTLLSGYYYHQFGKDVAGNKVNAFDFNVQLTQQFKLDEEKGSAFRLTAGLEILSGTSGDATDQVNRSFAPLYGTNHAHNGYMDLFFVGGRHEQQSGLQDYFLRTRYDVNSKLFLSANTHSFRTYGTVLEENRELSKNLGVEVDLACGYLINDAVSLQSGYSQLFASETMEQIRNVNNPANIQNWAYVMMIYRPTMKNRFIGLLF